MVGQVTEPWIGWSVIRWLVGQVLGMQGENGDVDEAVPLRFEHDGCCSVVGMPLPDTEVLQR